nr:hypothetical protein Iba_chr07aCG14140 [Ipomoea batatas]
MSILLIVDMKFEKVNFETYEINLDTMFGLAQILIKSSWSNPNTWFPYPHSPQVTS